MIFQDIFERDLKATLAQVVYRLLYEGLPQLVCMWAHYGNGHKGVCLIFETDSSEDITQP